MAEETITILKVGTDESIKSVGDLRENIKLLKAQLNELEIGTEDYKNTLEELRVNQNAVKDAMYATTASMDDVAKSATGVSKTYNGLVHQMAALKEELRATDVSTEAGKKRFSELAMQIQMVNNDLKEMDAQQGNFQRNVGDYSGSILDAFGKMGGGVGQAAKSVTDFKDKLVMVGKVPIVLVISSIVTVLDKLGAAMKGSETTTRALTQAFAPFKAAGDLVDRMLQGLGNAVSSLANGLTKLLDKWGLLSEEAKQRQAEARERIALTDLEREYMVRNAEDEQKISELRAKMAEKDKYSAQQRLKWADEWKTALLDVAQRNKELAQRELELAEAEASHSENSAEVNQKLAELRVKAIQAQTNYNNQLREANAQIAEISASAKAAAQSTAREASGVAKEVADLVDKVLEDTQTAFDTEVKVFEEKEQEKLKIAKDSEARRLQEFEKYNQRRLTDLDNSLITDKEREARRYEIEHDALLTRIGLLEDFKKAALERNDIDAFLEYSQEIADTQVEIEQHANARKKALYEQDVANRKEAITQVASATTAILGSIADLYESNTELSVEEAKKVKNLRISSAIIETISGAVAAYMSAQSLPTPTNMIVGALNAATVTAAGLAQIAKLRNAQVSTTSSGGSLSLSSAIANAPSVQTEVQNVRSVTSASEEEMLNATRNQRVYIVQSDIEAAAQQSRVQVQESSF